MKEVRMKITKKTNVIRTPIAKLPALKPATSLVENSRSEGDALGEAPTGLLTEGYVLEDTMNSYWASL